MKIREADQSDYYGCLEVVPTAWRSPQFDARLGAQLYYDTAFVAVDEPEVDGAHDGVPQVKKPEIIIGFLTLDTTFFDLDGVYLRTLLVRPGKQQGLDGIGGRLMRTAIKWAFSAGARRVFADVTNPALGVVLEKGGFEKVGEIKHMHREDELYTIYSLQAGSHV